MGRILMSTSNSVRQPVSAVCCRDKDEQKVNGEDITAKLLVLLVVVYLSGKREQIEPVRAGSSWTSKSQIATEMDMAVTQVSRFSPTSP